MFCYKVFSLYHIGLNTKGLSSQIMCDEGYEVLYRKNKVCYPEKKDSLLFVFKRLKDALRYTLNEQIWICECEIVDKPTCITFVEYATDYWEWYNSKTTETYSYSKPPPEGTYFAKWVKPLNVVEIPRGL